MTSQWSARAKRRWYIGLALLGPGLAVALLFWRRPAGISSYQGKSLKSWAMQTVAREPKNQQEAAAAFKAMGSNAVPGLLSLLKSRDSALQNALWSLANKLPPPFKSAATSRLHPPNATMTRQAAARALAAVGSDAQAAIPALVEVMRKDKAQSVSWEAAHALGHIGGPAVGELATALADADPHVRYSSACGLGELGPDAAPALPALFMALEDEAAAMPASTAISRLGPAAVALLTNDLQSADRPTRRRAAKAVGCIRPPRDVILPLLVSMAHAPDPADRTQAVQSLCGLGLPNNRIVNAILEALKDPDAQVRLAAVCGLSTARMHAKLAVAALANVLEDPSPAVRETAARVLGTFGVHAQPVSAKLERLAETDEAPPARAAAKEALARIQGAAKLFSRP